MRPCQASPGYPNKAFPARSSFRGHPAIPVHHPLPRPPIPSLRPPRPIPIQRSLPRPGRIPKAIPANHNSSATSQAYTISLRPRPGPSHEPVEPHRDQVRRDGINPFTSPELLQSLPIPEARLDESLDGLHNGVARSPRLRQRIRSCRPDQQIHSFYSPSKLYNSGSCGTVISDSRSQAPWISQKHQYGQRSQILELLLARIHGTLKDRPQYDHREPPRQTDRPNAPTAPSYNTCGSPRTKTLLSGLIFFHAHNEHVIQQYIQLPLALRHL